MLFGIDPEGGIEVPPTDLAEPLIDLLRFPGVMDAVAGVYDGDAVFPHSVEMVESWRDVAFGNPCLLLVTENQGVCAWAVPLTGDDDPPVRIAGDLSSGRHAFEFALPLPTSSMRWLGTHG